MNTNTQSPIGARNELFCTPEEIAGRWGWHQESVRRLLRERRLPALKIGNRVLVKIADLIAFENGSYMPVVQTQADPETP